MIALTRINGSPLVLNSDLIEQIESKPDTIIRLSNGQRVVVRETPAEVVDLVVAFRQRLHPVVAPGTVVGGE
ncbi:MAG: flagellar FlbD family protein [Acidobacteria bacterium]|jgi:flagellar protein FlbD|nr:flagellar FlbD family protein [Acidobacteriota bacterium]